MCIFKKAKKNTEVNKTQLSEAELKFNKMWDLWAKGEIKSPYADLMTYQSEVNNGGHAQFFDNVSSTGHLKSVMRELQRVLPNDVRIVLSEAYDAYRVNGPDAEENEAFYEHADEVFYEKEHQIDKILEKFSEGIEL
jgi:hypothetical protein